MEELETEVPSFFRGICRACIKKNTELFPLFGGAKIKFGDKCFTISEIFFLGGRVKTSFEDKLPKHVCRKCLTRMIEIFSFQLKCIESDVKLKSILSKQILIQKEESQLSVQNKLIADKEHLVKSEKNDSVQINSPENLFDKSTSVSDLQENGNINNNKGSISDIVVSILEDKDQQVSVSMTVTLNDKNQLRQPQDNRSIQEKKDLPNSKDNNISCQLSNELIENNCINESDIKHGKFICTFCKDSFDTWSDLGKHIIKHKIQNNYGRLTSESPKMDLTSEIEIKEKILQDNCDIYMENHSHDAYEDCYGFDSGQSNEMRLSVLSEREMPILTSFAQPNRNGRYYCDFCPVNYKYSKDVKRHLAEKHIEYFPNDQKYECSICGERFIWHLAYTKHKRTHKNNSCSQQVQLPEIHKKNSIQQYKCLICFKILKKYVNLKRHLSVVHNVKRIDFKKTYQKLGKSKYRICQHCGRYLMLNDIQNYSAKRNKEKGKYSCSACEKKFKKKSNICKVLPNISTNNEDISLNSELLDKSENSLEIKNSNVENKENTTKELNISDEISKTDQIENTVIEDSLVLKDKIINGRSYCHLCPRHYGRRGDLLKHIRSKHKLGSKKNVEETVKLAEGEWKCKECPAIYIHKRNLYSHVKQKHQELEELTKTDKSQEFFECEICQRKFSNGRTFDRHASHCHREMNYTPIKEVDDETGKSIFKCRLCDNVFNNIFKWRSHTFSKHRTNSTSKSYECSTCKKKFVRQSSLKCHIKIHELTTGKVEKNDTYQQLSVELENKSTQKSLVYRSLCPPSNNTDLNTANKIHKCLICPSIFENRSNLRRHARTHHSEKVNDYMKEKTKKHLFQCLACYKWFLQKANFTTHTRRHLDVVKDGQTKIKCEICNKNLDNIKQYTHHLGTHRTIAKKMGTYCKECLIIFRNEKAYKLHMTNKHRVSS